MHSTRRSKHPQFKEKKGIRPEMNISEEDMQDIMQEHLQETDNACSEKAEGGTCLLENPRGKMSGTCTAQEDVFVCILEDMPKRDGEQSVR